MKLHLVGGFLGSGKTTAIIQAAKALMQRGQRVGVVTNDQGKYLVDTAFVRLADVPAVEVTGGCFCCNYADLDERLDVLAHSAQPDVIFAESVGSCADVVATVLKPLMDLKTEQVSPASLSVFTDGRLLLRRLRDQPMPFSEDVMYIFDKQIEEAGLVVVNKADLLQPDRVDEVLALVGRAYPGKTVLMQDSRTPRGVEGWLTLLDAGEGLLPEQSLAIDYVRYGRGEAQLAWLDEQVNFISSTDEALPALKGMIETVLAALKKQRASIGHLKFILDGEEGAVKLSFPTLDEPAWEEQLPVRLGKSVRVLVNARVEMNAKALRMLFSESLAQLDGQVEEVSVDYFHPRQPTPTYRYD